MPSFFSFNYHDLHCRVDMYLGSKKKGLKGNRMGNPNKSAPNAKNCPSSPSYDQLVRQKAFEHDLKRKSREEEEKEETRTSKIKRTKPPPQNNPRFHQRTKPPAKVLLSLPLQRTRSTTKLLKLMPLKTNEL